MSLFFKSKVHSARNKAPRYDDMMMVPQHLCLLVILKSFDNLADAGAKGVVVIFL